MLLSTLFCRRLTLLATAVICACAGGGRTETAADARAFVDSRWRQHFREGQGFSVETLRARQAWFTPRLYTLMLADMDTPAGEVGSIDADPFTDSQEQAARFTVGPARASHDTVFVDVELRFDSTAGDARERQHVVAAVVPAEGGWRIANFVARTDDLASQLTRAAAASRP